MTSEYPVSRPHGAVRRLPGQVTDTYVYDHHGWTYTTHVIDVAEQAAPKGTGIDAHEAGEHRWVTADETTTLPLIQGADDAIRQALRATA